MSKYIVAFTDRTPTETVEADYYTWFAESATFTDLAACEHDKKVVVAQFAGHLVRSIRLDDE